MSMRVILTAVLLVFWLNCCAEDGSVPYNIEARADTCEAIATTGDMYRSCMEVGPENILLPDMAFRVWAIRGEARASFPSSRTRP